MSTAKDTKKKAKKKTAPAEANTKQPSNEMKKMLSSIMKDMASVKEKKDFKQSDNSVHLNIREIRDEVNLLSSSVSARLANVEVKVAQLNDSVEEIKKMAKERNSKIDADIEQCLKTSLDSVEEERNKRLKLMKALQKKLSEDDEAIIDRVVKVKDELSKAISSILDQTNSKQSDLAALKQRVEEISFHSKPQTESPGKSFAKSDAGQIMIQLNARLRSIEERISSNRSECSGASDDEFDVNEEAMLGMFKQSRMSMRHNGQEDMPPLSHRNRSRTLSGGSIKHSGSDKSDSLMKVVWQLKRQVESLEGDVERNRLMASDAYTAATGKRFGSKGMDSGENKGFGDALKEQEQDIRTLAKRLKQLGDNTSKACRSLSTGLTDVQQASLHLYAWCDKAHAAFGTLSTHQNLTKNVCPRVQVYRSGLATGDVTNMGV